jgi:uncharacterized membrane protein YgcG
VRYLIRFAVAAALLLLLAAPALAQGRLILEDPGGRLDRQAVQDAARPLVNRGAVVAVYFVDGGGGQDAARQDFTERMVDSGIARADGALLSNVVAIYVALDDRYSEIAYGDEWSDALLVNNNAELIRNDQLNPGLSDGDYTRGVVNGLSAIDDAIANPPSPNGSVNVDTFPIAAALGGLALAGGGVALYAGRRRTAKARASAQQRLKDAREGAGAVIAELGRRFNDSSEKAKFDKVSYAAADVQRVQALQQEASGRFLQVQERFDDVGEGLERYEKPTNEQMAAAAAGYDEVKTEAQGVGEALKAVEDLRAQLDEQARTAREELDRAKKA